VDTRAGLEDMEKWKFLLHWDSYSEPLIVQPVASRYINCAIPALYGSKCFSEITLAFDRTARI
jgi:hypothetical protein